LRFEDFTSPANAGNGHKPAAQRHGAGGHQPELRLPRQWRQWRFRASDRASAWQGPGEFAQDAAGHDDVVAFIKQCQQQDADRAMLCHQLLGQLTVGGTSGLRASG